MGYWRQFLTLTGKNLRIAVQRHWLSTLIRAVLAPIIFMFFIAYMKNFFVPPSQFGIGSPVPIRGFIDALEASDGGRDTVAFVKNGYNGGDIENLIEYLSVPIRTAGKTPRILDSEADLLTVCRSSLRAASACYGAAVFHSSPTEGISGFWNYTLRADGALGSKIYVNRHDNDQEIYVLPFQRAIDMAIVNQFSNGSTSTNTLPDTVNEYPYTAMTQTQRKADIRRLYMNTVIRFLGIAYILGIIGIVYHLTGRMAYERELGMSQLIEAMVPNHHRWQTQAIRLLSTHIAFDIIWLPGWIVMAIILRALVYTQTSYAIVIGMQVLSGLAFSSWSILGGSLFHKAQLSGIVVIIVSLILAILIQVQTPKSTGAIAALGFLFTPMNYILQVIYMARFERVGQATNLIHGAPTSDTSAWTVPGIALWFFLIVQIVVYPILGALIEQLRYGTSSKARKVSFEESKSANAITLRGFSKSYAPSWWARRVSPRFGGERKDAVLAVKGLDLNVLRGQILCLLGANGSGKSTTLDAIAGLNTITGGEVDVDGNGGIGYCPQKNVLWDELTVYEHVAIFNGLKTIGKIDDEQSITALVEACDLGHKIHAKSKTLSGGQKRKLQLAMMFTGGSHVCCIDEVSSGLDPLSRRKIWDILLRERGVRTLLLTTHFLDEADVLADHIALMSKGNLKAEGSAAELKHRFGGGYRVQIMTPDDDSKPLLGDRSSTSVQQHGGSRNSVLQRTQESHTYELLHSEETSGFLQEAEKQGFSDYTVHGPSIEDVFLKLSEEAQEQDIVPNSSIHDLPEAADASPDAPKTAHINSLAIDRMSKSSNSNGSITIQEKRGLDLLTGSGTTLQKQTWILFKKRLTVLRRNYIPYVIAVLLPIVVAGLVTFFLRDEALGCSPSAQVDNPDVNSFDLEDNRYFVAGPTDRIDKTLFNAITGGNNSLIHFVDSYDAFTNEIATRYQNVTPGGIYLGDTPTMAYVANYVIAFAMETQNLLDQSLAGFRIGTQFKQFAVPFSPSAGKTLQLIFYFGLSMVAYPGFFALYPTVERLRKVRALHYSNGVRAAPLWLSYTMFDFMFVLLISVVVTVIWAAVSDVWYSIGYLFVVFFLYGLTSTLLSYVISLYTTSQLATYAWCVGFQAVMFLIYFISLLSILTYTAAFAIDHDILVSHFAIALITPAGNLLRALLLTLNEFSVSCHGDQLASYPGDITVYGGPILYLIVQAMILFVWLVWYDSGYKPGFFQRFGKSKKRVGRDTEAPASVDKQDEEAAAEIVRTESTRSGLQVQHLTKTFGAVTAVDDITFTVSPSECFALLGPNGAGKSTTISLIRGDLRPDHDGGDVLVEGSSVTSHRASARRQLGVCPQFDAMDLMTVAEHLHFYAQARGVPDPQHNVDALISAVNLHEYRDRIAHKLSGGNKRKLSLAIALVGNPAVLLLDEPSSGMDAANKRFLWKTLLDVTKGRSMLITTHSMEEADKLADRAGIMAGRMLALGTSAELRSRFGERWYIQIVLEGAPHVGEERTRQVREWVERAVEGAEVEERMWYGQLRFSVPVKSVGIAELFRLLEENKEMLGLEYYSVSRATLDQVFLEVVTRHNIEEEGESALAKGKRTWREWGRKVFDDA